MSTCTLNLNQYEYLRDIHGTERLQWCYIETEIRRISILHLNLCSVSTYTCISETLADSNLESKNLLSSDLRLSSEGFFLLIWKTTLVNRYVRYLTVKHVVYDFCFSLESVRLYLRLGKILVSVRYIFGSK